MCVPPPALPVPPHRLGAASSLAVPRCGAGGRGAGAALPFSGSSGSFAGTAAAAGGSAPAGFRPTDLGDKKCRVPRGARPPPGQDSDPQDGAQTPGTGPAPLSDAPSPPLPDPRGIRASTGTVPNHVTYAIPEGCSERCQCSHGTGACFSPPGPPRDPQLGATGSPPPHRAQSPVLGIVLVGSGTQRHLPFAGRRLVLIDADPLCQGMGAQRGGVPSPLSPQGVGGSSP